MNLLKHPWLVQRTSMVLGVVLIFASYHKIVDPPDFAKILFNYKMIPAGMINVAAIYLPWLELLLGLALFTGVYKRGASFLTGIMFVGFIVALSVNLARECPTICGCFDTYEAGKELTDAEKYSKMRWEIALDCVFVALAAHIFVTSKEETPPTAT